MKYLIWKEMKQRFLLNNSIITTVGWIAMKFASSDLSSSTTSRSKFSLILWNITTRTTWTGITCVKLWCWHQWCPEDVSFGKHLTFYLAPWVWHGVLSEMSQQLLEGLLRNSVQIYMPSLENALAGSNACKMNSIPISQLNISMCNSHLLIFAIMWHAYNITYQYPSVKHTRNTLESVVCWSLKE